MATYKEYPNPVRVESGCKVGWNWYETEEDAKACSEAAEHNAEIQWSQGYDFGYCCPGSISKREQEDGTLLYRVCIP